MTLQSLHQSSVFTSVSVKDFEVAGCIWRGSGRGGRELGVQLCPTFNFQISQHFKREGACSIGSNALVLLFVHFTLVINKIRDATNDERFNVLIKMSRFEKAEPLHLNGQCILEVRTHELQYCCIMRSNNVIA